MDYICVRCHGNCDAGELIGNVCIDCFEEEKEKQIRTSHVARIINSPFEQMELNLEVINGSM